MNPILIFIIFFSLDCTLLPFFLKCL